VWAGPDWGLLSLLAVAPAVAAIVGGVAYTLAAGAAALALAVTLDVALRPATSHRAAEVIMFAVAAVTGAAILGIRARQRRDAELVQVRGVAEAAQRVLLRPVPSQVHGVALAVSYASASSGARVGGDFYEAVPTADGVRLIVGDVQGKGLPALQTAAAVLGVFREAAYDPAGGLAGIIARIEITLARELRDEQFVTAVLAEIRPDCRTAAILNCGHPLPLLLGPGGSRFAGEDDGSMPLGMTHLARVDRVPFTVPFYTDGATEARGSSGEFFSLSDSANGPKAPLRDPPRFVQEVRDQVTRHVGHAPDDDLTLLLAYLDPEAVGEPSGPRPPAVSAAASAASARPPPVCRPAQ
jgi:serine phosphatase RsbU (regulator of sigma subunit)